MVHKGHAYTKKRESNKHTMYWCKYKRGLKCEAKLFLKPDKTVTVDGEHNRECKVKNNQEINTIDLTSVSVVQCETEMNALIEELALGQLGLRPQEIWNKVSTKMNEKYATWNGYNDQQVIRKVHYLHSRVVNGDVKSVIETPQMLFCKKSGEFFCSSMFLW